MRPSSTNFSAAVVWAPTQESSLRAKKQRKSGGHTGVSPDDSAWLVDTVARQADISRAEAEDRVNRVTAESASALHRLRTAAVLQAFLIAAALLAGAAVAWFSAAEGGRDRERGAIPVWDWSFGPR